MMLDDINSQINGRIAMWQVEVDLLTDTIREIGDADHLEIGCLWGGSAILAALTKKKYDLKGNIYSIDLFDGRHADGSLGTPTLEIVKENLAKCDVSDRVTLIKWSSFDWPIPAERRFGSILIDGDHSYYAVTTDFKNAKLHADRFILFHDYYPSVTMSDQWHYDVYKDTVTKAVNELRDKQTEWGYVTSANSLALFERLGLNERVG